MRVNRDYQVPSVAKAIDILEFVWKHSTASFPKITGDLGLPKTTTYQILKTLEARGYIRHVGESREYVLGLRLFELGNAAVARVDIRAEAMPILRDLMSKTNQVCNLGVIEEHEAVYLAKVDSTQGIRINTWVGMRMPLHCTAMGKVLLAWKEESFVDEILGKVDLKRGTKKAIADQNVFKKEIQSVQQKGWALDDEEFQSHIRCVAVPVQNIRNEVIASISISGLVVDMDDSTIREFSELAKTASKQLSLKLGSDGAEPSKPSSKVIG